MVRVLSSGTGRTMTGYPTNDPRSLNSRLAGPQTCRWCGFGFDVPVGMDLTFYYAGPDPREGFRAVASGPTSARVLHECADGVLLGPVEQVEQ